MITKCHCGCTDVDILFTVRGKDLVKCVACEQVYIKDFKYEEIIYNTNIYFTEKNSHINNYAEFYSIFQSIIEQIKKFKHSGELLDVGCGIGILVEAAQKNGFTAKGIEISDWASSYGRSRGLDILTGDLVNAKLPSCSFDIVVLNHVLEHLPNPTEILEEIYRILKDNGILVIGVPNFASYMAKLRKEKWASLIPDEHIWHFTHETLANLINKYNFEECFFEAKKNHKINRNLLTSIPKLVINIISILMNNSEAMLLFAKKVSNKEND